MIYSPFLIISLPLILSFILAFFTYEVKDHFFEKSLVLFSFLILMTLFMEILLKYLKIEIRDISFFKNKIENKLAIYFGFFIVIFCIIDLYIRGPLLFTTPSMYDTLSPTETYIRYITIMCWSLIPIAFFCTENKMIKILFCTTAILFPIIAVDRNRFLSSIYAFVVVFIMLNKEKMKKEDFVKYLKKITFSLILIATCSLMIFSFVGEKRSSLEKLLLNRPRGQLRLPPSMKHHWLEKSLFFQKTQAFSSPTVIQADERVQTKYDKLKNINKNNTQQLEFKKFFVTAPTPLKWLLIYASIGVFNFAVIQNIDYRDTDYLNYQLFRRFRHDIPQKYEDLKPKPIPFPPLSVCTEFLPFFLYGGSAVVIFSFLLLCTIYFYFLNIFSKSPSSIFLLLGFLKMSYCCIMLGFGPQFFTFTNLVFLILMMFMHKFSNSRSLDILLKSKMMLLDQKKTIRLS